MDTVPGTVVPYVVYLASKNCIKLRAGHDGISAAHFCLHTLFCTLYRLLVLLAGFVCQARTDGIHDHIREEYQDDEGVRMRPRGMETSAWKEAPR